MANVNTTLVSNFEALPQIANNAHELHGVKRVAQGTIALDVSANFQSGDVVFLAPIPTNASITSIQIANDDLDSGSTVTFDVGLYDSEDVAVDADCYVDGSTAFRAAAGFTEYRFSALDINTAGQQIWEDAGASANPGGFYYLAITAAANADTDGDVSFIVEYVVN
jgi:hypothetical protein